MKESPKLLIALVVNEDLELASMDFRATFLQMKTLNRDVYMKPPEDQRNPGKISKLKKLLHGLNDASRKF